MTQISAYEYEYRETRILPRSGFEPDPRIAELEAERDQLRQALAGYVVLGKGKCTIGKDTADKGLAALNNERAGQ